MHFYTKQFIANYKILGVIMQNLRSFKALKYNLIGIQRMNNAKLCKNMHWFWETYSKLCDFGRFNTLL